ncbi:MAG: hypothetical protein HY240_01645, partial [Actinobacteria bacterium]|nr:hypothetical protein [Actinomycetota bacterium]
VTVNGDTIDEPNETYTVGLSNPVSAAIADGSGLGTITDDDAPPSLTVSVAKTKKTVTAKGLLAPGTSGMKVTVTLYKKKGARYVKVSTRTVTVGTIADRNGDGTLEAAYAAKFKRPARGAYKFKAVFKGDADHLPCSASKTFKL